MASIVKYQGKSKKITYYVVYRVDGEQIKKRAGYTKDAALKLKAKIENELFQGTYIDIPDISVREFTKKWLAAKKPDIRPQTYKCYEGHIRLHIEPYFDNRKVKSISVADIEGFKAHLFEVKMNPATIAKYLLTVKMLFKSAVVWGYILRNPAEHVKKPQFKRYEPNFLSYEQLEHLVRSTPKKHKALIATACFTGMRQGELLGLKWSDVDFERKKIYIQRTLQQGKFYEPKASASKRSIDIPGFLITILSEHQLIQMVEVQSNRHNLVFPNSVGNPRDNMGLINRVFKPLLKLADLPGNIRFHDLRHSYASMLIAQNANIKFIQKQLGHANIQMTLNTYSHLLPDAGMEAINNLELKFERPKSDHLLPVIS